MEIHLKDFETARDSLTFEKPFLCSEGMMICVIPNSCEGQSQTVTEPTPLTRTFVCSSGSANTDGVTYATFTDCVAQCTMVREIP
jgi:hypothetical protein